MQKFFLILYLLFFNSNYLYSEVDENKNSIKMIEIFNDLFPKVKSSGGYELNYFLDKATENGIPPSEITLITVGYSSLLNFKNRRNFKTPCKVKNTRRGDTVKTFIIHNSLVYDFSFTCHPKLLPINEYLHESFQSKTLESTEPIVAANYELVKKNECHFSAHCQTYFKSTLRDFIKNPIIPKFKNMAYKPIIKIQPKTVDLPYEFERKNSWRLSYEKDIYQKKIYIWDVRLKNDRMFIHANLGFLAPLPYNSSDQLHLVPSYAKSSHNIFLKLSVNSENSIVAMKRAGKINWYNILDNSKKGLINDSYHEGIAFINENTIAYFNRDNAVKAYNIETSYESNLLPGLKDIEAGEHGTNLQVSSDGTLLALGSNKGRIQVWRLEDRKLLFERKDLYDWARIDHIEFSPDNSTCAVQHYYPNKINVWNIDSGRLQITIPPGKGNISIGYIDSGKFLFANQNIWDIETGKRAICESCKQFQEQSYLYINEKNIIVETDTELIHYLRK